MAKARTPQWIPKEKPATAKNFLSGMTPSALVKLPVSLILNLPVVREYIDEEMASQLARKYGDGVLGDLDTLDLATVALAAMSRTDTSQSVPDEITFICPSCRDVHVIPLK